MDYQCGKEFVTDLHKTYGLLQAFRMVDDYMKIPVRKGDEEEQRFRREIAEAMNALERI